MLPLSFDGAQDKKGRPTKQAAESVGRGSRPEQGRRISHDKQGQEKVGPGLAPGRVYINKTQYFEGVPKEVWEFHIGGYQVCEKWLKDRKGRTLSWDDIQHYQKIVIALKETIRLMAEIDALIPSWPLS